VSTTVVSSRERLRLAQARIQERSTWAVASVLALFSVVAFVLLYRKGFGTTFYYDEWNFLMNRRGWTIGTFLEPHNEHLSLVPIAVYKLLFVTVGIDDYAPYRATVLLVHLLCVALLFMLARRRVGDLLGAIVVLPILFLGTAWQDLLWPFQIGYLASVAAGLAMLLALERGTAAGDVAACVLIAVALASSSIGIPVAVLALVELVARREPLRRLWIVAAPVTLYLLWSLVYGNPRAAPGAQDGLWPLLRLNIPDTPGYMASAAAGAFGALTGWGIDWGRPLVILAAIGITIWLASSRPFSPRALAVLAAAATYWGLTGLFRAQLNVPAESRYLYFGAILLVLLGVEFLRGLQLSNRVLALLGVLALAFSVSNFGPLQDGSLGLQTTAGFVAPELGALELAGPSTDPQYRPDPARAPDIFAGRYFDTIEELGSPADRPDEIAHRLEPERQAADAVLAQALGMSLEPVEKRPSPGGRPTIDAVVAGQVTIRPGCVTMQPTAPGAVLDGSGPPSGIAITTSGDASVEARVRQFASAFPEAPLGTVGPHSTSRLRFPARPGLGPWHVRLTPSEPVTVCGLPRPLSRVGLTLSGRSGP
jgi:hypothetical protein